MRVAIIGAGAAGLASARHVSSQGIQCEVLEMTSEIGGIWVYTDDVKEDKYGHPVHTVMYKNLRTNLSKELMGFPDFPVPEENDSFLSQETVLEFLHNFAHHFKLKQLIKFNQIVTEVRPFEDGWRIQTTNRMTKETTTNNYDYVIICNGHFNTPIIPNIPNIEKFKGHIMHSNHYRSNEQYKDKRVLIIGAGPSGVDIAFQVAEKAKQVVISYRSHGFIAEFPSNLFKKPEVLRINEEQQVEFVDGSCCSFDAILFCTGYKYNFPFLHKDCGITVEENLHIRHLYKHMINIEKPSMCFIGIPNNATVFTMVDIQARFYCQYLNGLMQLPSKECMYAETEEDINVRKLANKRMHILAYDQQKYYDELATMAKITPIRPVICKIWNDFYEKALTNFHNLRKYKYIILSDDSFVTERYID